MAVFSVNELQQYPEIGSGAPLSFRVDDVLDAGRVPVDKTVIDAFVSMYPDESPGWQKAGKIGPFEQLSRMKNNPAQQLPKAPLVVGGTALSYNYINMGVVQRRLQEDKYGDNLDQKAKDTEYLRNAFRYEAEAAVRGFTMGGAIVEGVSYLPGLMVDMFATAATAGFVGAGARASVAAGMAGVKSAALKTVASKTAGFLAQGVATTALVGIPTFVGRSYQNESMLNLEITEEGVRLHKETQSNPAQSVYRAMGSTYLDYTVERAGEIFFDPAIKRLAGSKYFIPLATKMAEIYKKIPGNNRVSALFTKTGWNGMASELGEEYLQKELSALFYIEDFGKPGYDVLDQMVSALGDGEEFLVTLGVLAVPGMAKVGLSAGANKTTAMLDAYRARRRQAGVDAATKVYTEDLPDDPRKLTGFDIAQANVEEALSPMPSPELSDAELEALRVSKRGGDVTFEDSKPIPERKIPASVASTKATAEYQAADEKKKLELLIRGRTADLDQQRVAIEERMTSLEQEVNDIKESGGEGAILEGKRTELAALSKQLLSVHAQLSDVSDYAVEDLQEEQVRLKGSALESLRKTARDVGVSMERARLRVVMRDQRATDEERRVALVKYLQARLPGADNAKLREKYNLRSAKNFTEAKLRKFFAEIEELRNEVLAKQLRAEVERIADKMAATVNEQSQLKGRFGSVDLQRVANIIRDVVATPAAEVEAAIREVHAKMTALENAGETSGAEFEALHFRLVMLSSLGGKEARSVDQLENSVKVITKAYADLLNGRDSVLAVREAQRKALETGLAQEIEASRPKITNPLRRAVSFMVRNKLALKIASFSGSNLTDMLEELASGKKDSFLTKMVADPLRRAINNVQAFSIVMRRPFIAAIKEIYDLDAGLSRKYFKFITDKMGIQDTDIEGNKPFLRDNITLLTGKTKAYRLPMWTRMYWYALTHITETEVDGMALETFTNTNQMAAIEDEVRQQNPEADLDEINRMVQERAAKEVKGNAIPEDVFNEIINIPEKEKRLALRMREIFASYWPMVNKVYSRNMGVDLGQIQSYIPNVRDKRDGSDIIAMFDEMAMIESHMAPAPTSTKVRTPNASAPFAEISLLQVFDNFVNTMGPWLATREAVARVQWMIKNPTLRQAINKATDGIESKTQPGYWMDGAFIKMMEFHLQGISSQGKSDVRLQLPFYRFLARMLGLKFLGFEIKAGFQQVMSLFAVIGYRGVRHRDFIVGMTSFLKDPKGAHKLLQSGMSGYERYKNITAMTAEYAFQVSKSGVPDKLFGVDALAYLPLRSGDKASAVLGGWVVFKKVYDETKDPKKAYDAYDDFVENLLQSGRRGQQSAFMAGPYKILAQFSGAIQQYFRYYNRAWVNMVKDPSKENIQHWARVMVVMHVYIPAARWFLQEMFKPEPDEEEDEEEAEEKKKKALLFEMVQGPFAGAWLLGMMTRSAATMITGERGFDASVPVVNDMNKTLRSLETAVAKAMDEAADDEEVMDAWIKAGKGVLGLTPAGSGAITNTAEMFYRHAAGEWDPTTTWGVLYGHSTDIMDYHRRIYE